VRALLGALAALAVVAAPAAAAAPGLVGTVFPYAEIPIVTARGGKVARIPVEEGARVRRGQLLVALDRARPLAEIKLLETQIAHKAALRLEELALATAREDLKRDEQLSQDGTVTPKALDDSRNRVKLAVERVSIERGRLDEQRQTLAMRMRDLAEYDVVSPGDGILTGMLVHQHEIVAAGTKVGDLLQMDRVFVEVFVPAASAGRLRPGTGATVHADGLGAVTARVKVLGQKVDPVSGASRVRLLAPNPGGRLKPGMIVRVRF